jgi:hypothetical protein
VGLDAPRVDALDDPVEVVVEAQNLGQIVSVDERDARRVRDAQLLVVVPVEDSERVGEDRGRDVEELVDVGVRIDTPQSVGQAGRRGVRFWFGCARVSPPRRRRSH